MSLVVRFAPESLTSDQYDHVVRRLNEENVSPADGLDYEMCFGSGDKMKVEPGLGLKGAIRRVR